jgi:hypothetical protein
LSKGNERRVWGKLAEVERTASEGAIDHFFTEVVRLILRFEDLNRDIAERLVAKIASNVGEATAREVRFSGFQREMHFRLVDDRIDHLRVAERDLDVVVIVLVELCLTVRRNFNVIGTHIFIVDLEMVMRLARNRDSGRCLSPQSEWQKNKR